MLLLCQSRVLDMFQFLRKSFRVIVFSTMKTENYAQFGVGSQRNGEPMKPTSEETPWAMMIRMSDSFLGYPVGFDYDPCTMKWSASVTVEGTFFVSHSTYISLAREKLAVQIIHFKKAIDIKPQYVKFVNKFLLNVDAYEIECMKSLRGDTVGLAHKQEQIDANDIKVEPDASPNQTRWCHDGDFETKPDLNLKTMMKQEATNLQVGSYHSKFFETPQFLKCDLPLTDDCISSVFENMSVPVEEIEIDPEDDPFAIFEDAESPDLNSQMELQRESETSSQDSTFQGSASASGNNDTSTELTESASRTEFSDCSNGKQQSASKLGSKGDSCSSFSGTISSRIDEDLRLEYGSARKVTAAKCDTKSQEPTSSRAIKRDPVTSVYKKEITKRQTSREESDRNENKKVKVEVCHKSKSEKEKREDKDSSEPKYKYKSPEIKFVPFKIEKNPIKDPRLKKRKY